MTDPRPSTEAELVEFVRTIDVSAPESLHARVRSLLADPPSGARRSFATAPRLAAAGAIAAGLAAVAIVIGLSGGSSALSPRAAAALTLRAATSTAPAERNRTELAASVDGVSFPYWGGRLGWRSTGTRSDRVAGRTVTTVFYSDGSGRRIGYAIAAGSAPRTSGGAVSWRGGTPYRLLSENGVPVVTWARGGHLCVLSGRGVGAATLLALASWGEHGSPA
jgi:hypothetical protein